VMRGVEEVRGTSGEIAAGWVATLADGDRLREAALSLKTIWGPAWGTETSFEALIELTIASVPGV
jgi:hypothetical protein